MGKRYISATKFLLLAKLSKPNVEKLLKWCAFLGKICLLGPFQHFFEMFLDM